MTQVVALASLAGIGIDIVAGDVVGCTGDEAKRLVDRHLARPFDAEIDSGRRVKSLHPETETLPSKTKRPDLETNTSNNDEIVIDMSQFPTAILLDTDTGVTQENVDALVAADLKDLEAVGKSTISALKKLDSIGAATVKKIRAGVEAIRLAAIDSANDPEGIVDNPDADSNTNTDEDNGEANQDAADQASEAEGSKA